MPQVIGSVAKYPARISFTVYAVFIALGTLVLWLPVCGASGRDPITLLDALFTATSATCVTGLSVRSTGQDFSLFGQAAILVMIQVGGIGIMTITTYFTFALGGRGSLRERHLIAETLGSGGREDLVWVLRNVLLATLLFESAGALLLFLRNVQDMSAGPAAWHAVFHAVSAFCNAGFGLFDDSLVRYRGDLLVNFTICTLIMCGGIGFPVLLDLQRNLRSPGGIRFHRLKLHSKVMLIGTALLVVFGSVSFLLIEWDDALKNEPLTTKLLMSLFQSVTTRTAGFNSVNMETVTGATLFIMILLMLVGAGPCSTGGGFKVSTASVLLMRAWATFQGFTRVQFFRRTVPGETVDRATASMILYLVTATVGLFLLLMFEQSAGAHLGAKTSFLAQAFEVVSALGTVGLSTGITAQLSAAAQLILVALMFLGRLGPFTVGVAISQSERPQPVEYPADEPLIG
jgi:trk system potassium uptake protein TrkH